ncbi:hypothetical protein Aperf_G00000117197 [Anoplocephala perfoliata]
MASAQFHKLINGFTIPQLGFGTFGAFKEVAASAVKEVFDVGYRLVDCAPAYGNEKEVEQGIAESMKKHGLKREDIFITSKLWCDKHDPKDVRKACENSLKNLGLDYLDLYLIHCPFSFHIKEGAKHDAADPNCLIFDDHKLEDTWTNRLNGSISYFCSEFSLAVVPSLQLNSGYTISQLGFGKFQALWNDAAEAVKEAFDARYLYINYAMLNETKRKLARLLLNQWRSTVEWCDKHALSDVRKACEETVKDLGLDYLELYLIHRPP